jgi:hypothetical protein
LATLPASQISENVVNASHELIQPDGSLVQADHGNPVEAIQGASNCVEAVGDQKCW